MKEVLDVLYSEKKVRIYAYGILFGDILMARTRSDHIKGHGAIRVAAKYLPAERL